MKIVIEINDETLHKAVEQQLGAVVSQFTDSIIQAKIHEITDKKLARIGESDVQLALTTAANEQIDRILGPRGGNTWQRDQKIKSYIADAAVAAIKAAK